MSMCSRSAMAIFFSAGRLRRAFGWLLAAAADWLRRLLYVCCKLCTIIDVFSYMFIYISA